MGELPTLKQIYMQEAPFSYEYFVLIKLNKCNSRLAQDYRVSFALLNKMM